MIQSQLDLTKPFIQTIEELFSDLECSQWIEKIKAAGTDFAPINTPTGAEINQDVRNNRRVIFDDEHLARELFQKIESFAPMEIHGRKLAGVNERIRCYEYQPGQRFAPHSDGAFTRNETEQSFYTFMIYLNDDFEGGETAFLVNPEKIIKPRTGMALLFQHPIIHEGCEVTKGVKFVVRTDLMYRQTA